MKIKSNILPKANFVGINIISSAIVLSRSVLFLKYLPDKDLGALILLQAIIGMFGLLQIGLFNGGLRVFSIDSYQKDYEKVNNNITTFILLISTLVFGGAIATRFFSNFNTTIVVLAIFIGSFSLLKNWFSNLLIARKKLKNINKITFEASILSALLSLLIFKFGLIGAIISIGSLPLSFVILFLLTNKEYRPNSIVMDYNTMKMVLVFGFIPYLSGIAMILYNQIDKFIIANVLSLEELGQFYLATVFLRVFVLVPTSINSLLAPNAINHYNERNLKATYKIFFTYSSVLIGYTFFVFVLLIFFGQTVVGFIFPEKIRQLHYLFILLPGMMATTVSGAFGFLLYVALHYKAILWNNIFSLLSYLGILGFMIMTNIFTLENVAYAKSLQGILVFVFLLTILLLSIKKLNRFYYLDKTTKKYNI